MKMEQTECFDTSEYKFQTPGNHPKRKHTIFLTVLVSGILCTWPNQLSLWALIQLTIFLCFIKLCSSSLVLILPLFYTLINFTSLTNLYLGCTHNPVNLFHFLEAIMFSPAVIHSLDCTWISVTVTTVSSSRTAPDTHREKHILICVLYWTEYWNGCS